MLEEEYRVRCVEAMAMVALAASGDACGVEAEWLEQGAALARSRRRWGARSGSDLREIKVSGDASHQVRKKHRGMGA